MRGYSSPSNHAKQVALVKASMHAKPTKALVQRPEKDMRLPRISR